MAEAKWSGVLSTTEPRNDVGIIKVRQGNLNSEIAEFQIVQKNKPYDLTGLTVYFCASFGLNLVEKPAVIVNATGGKVQYTFDDDSMQSLGRQKGYFSIKKEESKIDSTQDFEFQVESSLMTRSIDGKSYIYKLSALIKMLDDFVKNGQNNFNTWFDSVKEILYGVDPGGNILRELIEARKNSGGNIFASLKERLDKNEDETNRQLAQKATKGEIGITDLDKSKVQYDATWFSDSFLADLNNGAINTTFVEDESLITQKYADKSVTREKVSEFEISQNLFDKKQAVTGKVTTRAGEIITNELWSYYVYQIKPSTTYTFSHVISTWLVIYDDAGNRLPTPLDVPAPPTPMSYTMPVNARTIYINVRNTEKDVYMMVEGDTLPVDYIPYYTKIKSLAIEEGTIKKEWLDEELANFLSNSGAITSWSGKTLITFGDSISWYDGKTFGSTHQESGQVAIGYQTYLKNELGMTINNQGVSGNHMGQILARIRATDITNAHAVSITSGANDWTQQRPIGTLQPPKSIFDEETFYGAVQAAVESILQRNNRMKIILITPIRGYHPTNTHSGDWLSMGRTVGEIMEQPDVYAKAFKEIAEMYGLELIDFRDGTGMNFYNYVEYMGDTGEKKVHPKNSFYSILGKYAVSRFTNIPIQ